MNKWIVFGLLFFSSALQGQIVGELDNLCEIECAILPRATHRDRTGEHATHPHIAFANGTSTNWGGYVAATNLRSPSTKVVSNVTGSWTVPTLTATPDDAYSAIWVGIDGFSNGTVEQIGTSHDWVSGAQSDYAWFEMYPAGSYEIVGFPLNPGDVIVGTVTYKSGSNFALSLQNVTQNVKTTIPSWYTQSSRAKRSSAEWIVEAPYLNGILPLADFGIAGLTNCTCKINNHTGGINDSHWANEAITMVTANHTVKALPSNLSNGGTSFSVTWEHE